jgi:hypothetical protein
MGNLRNFTLALLLFSAPVVHSSEPGPPHVDTVEQFVAAFNAQDSNAMAEFVSDDIEWLSIAGEQISVEVNGKINLIESMNGYFESCPTCRSELSGVVSTASRVSAVEIASWQGNSGRSAQKAISVYEFSGEKITRVYYFSAEK